MTTPRLEIDFGKIGDNARSLVQRLGAKGIGVTGVTKATLGSPDIARELIAAGVRGLADSRIENLRALRESGVRVPLTLLRSPAPDQADEAAACANVVMTTDLDVAMALSDAASRTGRLVGIIVMVELGDLREGVMPADLADVCRRVHRTAGLTLTGIGTNLACQSGVVPEVAQMQELSALATIVESKIGRQLAVVSGGNSASLGWALSAAPPERVNDLRLGESILLGLDPLTRTPVEGLHTDAITLVASVIESRVKPAQPWGKLAQGAFGAVVPVTARSRGQIIQTILAVGEQDVDPRDISLPAGVSVLGASSDHLVVETPLQLAAGTEVRMGVGYSALLRAMTSPFVAERPTLPVAAPARARS
ncbi:MAG: alanine racemase [Actinobacteria bacterium HGW-Actinobacteria-4]|nr:MAG: alanine racemase [Actinobacteria bacterium HGW-Actinobacteria-4]